MSGYQYSTIGASCIDIHLCFMMLQLMFIFVQEKSKQAMKQVLGIKDEAARLRVTPPLAVAPLNHGEDMRWNPNDDGINFNPLRAPSARASL